MTWSFKVDKGPRETYDARVRAAALEDRPDTDEKELSFVVQVAQHAADACVAENVTITVLGR